MNILVTGAQGFVGRNLIPELLKAGHTVFALGRSKHKGKAHGVKWLQGDLLLPDQLPELPAIDKAYYLVHGLKGESGSFEYDEASAAVNFLNWVRPHSPDVIYLGGIVPDEEKLSPHLRSRKLTGAILGASGLNTLEFRASIVLGEDSLSFEMIKAIAERFPFTPELPLLNRPCQPIALEDLLRYLIEALSLRITGHKIYEIGGPDVASYGELIELYSRIKGLRRIKVKLPDVDSRVLMKVLDYAVPEHAQMGRKLTESLEHVTVVKDTQATVDFPEIQPQHLPDAMRAAASKSKSSYPPIWERDFIKLILSDGALAQSGLLSPELLKRLEQVGKLREVLTRKSIPRWIKHKGSEKISS